MAKSRKPARKTAAKRKTKTSKQPDLFGDLPASRRASGRGKSRPEPREKAAPRASGADAAYSAKHIEVLEGLEPVRRRPGMYIGGTDEKALHHLFAEVIDNAMDEALGGHATWIEVEMEKNGFVTVTDNGRGIPVDPHPKFPKKSALEVIMCMLHAGGKFDSKVYETSGGLHGVGVSVANALSDRMEVEVARSQKLYKMIFERGKPKGPLQTLGKAPNRRGTKVRFHPDPQIFGPDVAFKPDRVFRMTRSKAYLYGGVEILWHCAKELLRSGDDVPLTLRHPLFEYTASIWPNAKSAACICGFTRSNIESGSGRLPARSPTAIMFVVLSISLSFFPQAGHFARITCPACPACSPALQSPPIS